MVYYFDSSALVLKSELEGLVTYDLRMAEAAGRRGVTVCQPT